MDIEQMKIKTKTLISKTGIVNESPKWKLGYLEAAEADGRKFLTEEQYAHAVQLFDELAYEIDPTKSETQEIRKIHEFYELCDKGGVLGKINLRVYFAIVNDMKLILALAAYKKEDEGQVPPYIVIRVRNRLRRAKEILAQNIKRG